MGIHNVDWNCNGSVDSGTVSQEIDEDDYPWCGNAGTANELSDYNDWDNIADNARLRTEEIPTETVECISVKEAELQKHLLIPRHIENPNNCTGAAQPAVQQEACVAGLMIWTDAAHTGDEDGTGDKPFNTIAEAVNEATPGSVLYLQPGTFTNNGNSLWC